MSLNASKNSDPSRAVKSNPDMEDANDSSANQKSLLGKRDIRNNLVTTSSIPQEESKTIEENNQNNDSQMMSDQSDRDSQIDQKNRDNNQKSISSFFTKKVNSNASNGSHHQTTLNNGAQNSLMTSQKPQKYRMVGKNRLLPETLLRDETLPLKKLEPSENIFKIIMPWVKDEQDELKRLQKLQNQTENPSNKSKLGEKSMKQSSLFNTFKSNNTKQIDTEIKANAKDAKQEEENLKDVSKVIKVGDVTKYDFSYMKKVKQGKNKVVEEKVFLSGLEAILINPHWQEMTEKELVYDEQNTQEVHRESVKKSQQSINEDLDEEQKDQQVLKNKKVVNCSEGSSSENEDLDKDEDKKKRSGITMEQFSNLQIPRSVMKEGIIFIWTEKERIADVLYFFEKQDFHYIENMCFIMLDKKKQKDVERTGLIDATPSFVRESFPYLRKSKKTLLMLRRQEKLNVNNLELRHQRTGDVCFDFMNFEKAYYKPQFYTYRLIEILLPRGMIDPKGDNRLKMVELWAQDDIPRKGWLKVVGLNTNQ